MVPASTIIDGEITVCSRVSLCMQFMCTCKVRQSIFTSPIRNVSKQQANYNKKLDDYQEAWSFNADLPIFSRSQIRMAKIWITKVQVKLKQKKSFNKSLYILPFLGLIFSFKKLLYFYLPAVILQAAVSHCAQGIYCTHTVLNIQHNPSTAAFLPFSRAQTGLNSLSTQQTA